MRVKFLTLFLAGLITVSPFAFGAQSKLVHCAAYLEGMARTQREASESKVLTTQALQQLHLFRARQLSDYSFEPSNEPVNAGYYSFKSNQDKVAGRVSAILKEHRAMIQNDGQETFKQVLWASTVEGTDAIQAELLKRRMLRDGLREAVRDSQSINNFLQYIGMPMLGTSIASVGMFSVEQLLHGNLAAAGITGFMAVAFRFGPEVALRYFTLNTAMGGEEQRTAKNLENLEPGKWFYVSFDQEMPLSLMKEIAMTGRAGSRDLFRFTRWQTYPRITYALTGRRFVKDTSAEAPREASGWLRFDQVLRVNPSTGQPQLIMVVRQVEKLPTYPTRKPMEKPESESLSIYERQQRMAP